MYIEGIKIYIWTNKRKKEIIENSYLNSHKITTIEDVKKRLEGLRKSDEYNKDLKIKKDEGKRMNSMETPLGTLYTSSGKPNNRTAKAIFVDKKGKVLYNKGGK